MAAPKNFRRSIFTLDKAIFAIATMLLSYLCFMLFTLHRSQSHLQDIHVEQLKQDTEKRAAAVEYFFTERRDDLDEIARSREISVFFENKALGMSMEYGLALSLITIKEQFRELVRIKKIGSDQIYSRIVLLDASGNPLVDTEPIKIKAKDLSGWRDFIHSRHGSRPVVVAHEGKDMLASKAFFFKNDYKGQILAWIRFDKLCDHLIGNYPGSRRATYIVTDNTKIYSAGNISGTLPLTELPDFTALQERKPVGFTAAVPGDSKKKLLAVRVSIRDTPLSLINVAHADDVYGHPFSQRLLLTLGIVAVIMSGGWALLIWIHIKSLVLHTRLEESAKREHEIQEKNLQLEAEIAERSRAEEALRDSEQRFRGIVENIRDVYYRADAGGNLVMISPSVKMKLGYDSTEELIGRPLLSFWLHPEQRQKFLEILNYKGYVNDYEMTLKRKDGTPIEVSTSSYFYFDSAGNRLGTEGIARDITDRKRTEEQLREAHDMLKGYSARLEKEVQERTKDALEAQQQAEFANKAKSEFLANMNHELKTPLNAVIGFSEVMLNGLCGQLNERQVENLNYIYRGGKHLQRLIDGILELSRIEAGRMELDISEFLVKDVIQSSLFLFSEKAKRHSLELTYEVEEGLESITADPIMVKQVLCSLLSNAIKFTPDGGSIRVSAALRDNGKSVEFAVRDTGIGIAPEDQPKLFRPFTQLDSSYTKKYAGAGVGLRICKEIASLHGGTLEVKSVPGNGSTFYFTIPRHVGP